MRNNFFEVPLGNSRANLFLIDQTNNPTGSLKSRVATHMLNESEKRGSLTTGQTIIECTAGNNGIALAYESQKRGYKFIAVVSGDTPPEKVAEMRRYEAQVIIVDTTNCADLTSLMIQLKQEALLIRKSKPGSIFLDQADNPDNPESYRTLGTEIGRNIEGIRAFLGVVGTGGSLCGIGRGIKKEQPKAKIIAVNIEGSDVFSHKKITLRNIFRLFRPSKKLPKNIDFSAIDSYRDSNYREAVNACRYLNKQGVCAGILSSTMIFEALKLIQEDPHKNGSIVGVLGDSAKHLQKTVLNDEWMERQNLIDPLIEMRLKAWTLLGH